MWYIVFELNQYKVPTGNHELVWCGEEGIMDVTYLRFIHLQYRAYVASGRVLRF